MTEVSLARGAMVRSSSTVKRSPTGRIEHTHPNAFGAETTDVGENLYTSVTDDYKAGDNKFTGKINKVTIQVGKSNLSEEAQKAIEELSVKGLLATDQ